MKIHWQNEKIFFSRIAEPISSTLGTKHPWVKGIQVCSNEGSCPFPRVDNYEIVKIHLRNLKIFFSKTTWPISTKLGTMYPWVMRTQVCWNEGPHLFSRGDNYEIAKIHWKNWKIFFSRTAGPISNWYKAPLGKGDSSLFKWRTVKNLKKVNNVFFLHLINVMI